MKKHFDFTQSSKSANQETEQSQSKMNDTNP
jgi:hypothetical protein